jgi:AraC-like DNA-binding protein
MPSNTLIEWNFRPGIYTYESFTSFKPIELTVPQYPVVIPFSTPRELARYQDIMDLLIQAGLRDMPSNAHLSYVPGKVKNFLDQHFTEDIPLSKITKDLRMSHMTMTSKFKAHFGVTPVQYRNALRTFEAKRLLRENHSVTQAGLMAGFTSMTQYNQHFHSTFNHPPSIATKL